MNAALAGPGVLVEPQIEFQHPGRHSALRDVQEQLVRPSTMTPCPQCLRWRPQSIFQSILRNSAGYAADMALLNSLCSAPSFATRTVQDALLWNMRVLPPSLDHR